jgi:hypothetical protein
VQALPNATDVHGPILRDIERGGATEAITSSPNCYDGRERLYSHAAVGRCAQSAEARRAKTNSVD